MKNIFAVDDSITVRTTVEYTLSKSGYKVHLAEDGVNALEKLSKTEDKIDLFLFDVNMPNMDGLTLIKKVREIPEYKFTPILFLTTETQGTKKLKAQEAGASGWIVKPFVTEVLLKTISRFV